MTLEELTLEHTKVLEQLENTKQELETFKQNYEGLTNEKEQLLQDIQKLKNTNYELFERVNTKYKEIQEQQVSGNNTQNNTNDETSLQDVINSFK